MPRPLRIEFEGAWYLVQNQAAGKSKLFRENEDYERFLNLLGEISLMFGIEVHAYSLLPTSYTLLIHTPKSQISRAMRHLNGIYTQHYNESWRTTGSIFSSRFQSIIIDPSHYLTEALVYVHNKPVEAGICGRAQDHAYTSHRAYQRERDKPDWLQTAHSLKPLGFLKTFAVSKLNKLVDSGSSEEFLELIERERIVIGTESFKSTILKKSKSTSLAKSTKTSPVHVAKDILDFVSETYKTPVNALKKSSSGVPNEARNMAVYQLRSIGGLQQNEIARLINAPNGYTVAKSLQRFQQRLSEDEQLASKTAALSATILERIEG